MIKKNTAAFVRYATVHILNCNMCNPETVSKQMSNIHTQLPLCQQARWEDNELAISLKVLLVPYKQLGGNRQKAQVQVKEKKICH
jgi:hypothetical protein